MLRFAYLMIFLFNARNPLSVHISLFQKKIIGANTCDITMLLYTFSNFINRSIDQVLH